MLADGRSLWEALAAIRSTPISSELPSPAVLLPGRNLRGSLPFLQNRLVPQYVPAVFVRAQLQRRQASACFNHGGRPDIRGSALIVGQRVRAFVAGLWLAGAVEAGCSEPDSYVVRLTDGRAFRRTRRDINLENSPSAGFGVGHQSSGVVGPSSTVRGYRAPASASNLLPVLSWTPPTLPVLAVNRQAALSVPAAVNRPSAVPPRPLVVVNSSSAAIPPADSQSQTAGRQVVRKPWTAKVWPASSRSSSRVAAPRQVLSSEQRRSVSLSPTRPRDPVVQTAGPNLVAEPAAIQE
jgi:hypothetical protein